MSKKKELNDLERISAAEFARVVTGILKRVKSGEGHATTEDPKFCEPLQKLKDELEHWDF
jgi:hypothetical protein